MMDEDEKEALEAAGFRVGTAAEFLGLTDEEKRLVELRLAFERSWAKHEAGYRRLAEDIKPSADECLS